MLSVSLVFISCALGSNRADILRGDQDIDLFEKPLKMFFISSEKPFSPPIGAGDDFNLNDVVDKIHAPVLPTPLIGSRLGTHGERAENSDQLFTNLFDLLRFDLPAIVIFQWQVNLILFHAAREDLGRRTLLAGNFLNGIRFRLRIFTCSGVTP
ncbi:MAG TPA: hypothetical protein VGW77_12105 [Candidatus Binatia bacterium]|nr:hypothetical protein [Candidatus Binatia bacterium]